MFNPFGGASRGGVVGTSGKSAFQIALDNGFVGSVTAWLASLKGGKGDKGDSGTAATIAIGDVTTLPPGQQAAVTNRGTNTAAIFDIAIPRGATGATTGASWGDITGLLSDQTDLQTALTGKAPTAHTHGIADVTGLQGALDAKADSSALAGYVTVASKGAANGVAPLDGSGQIPAVYLPSYVDDVLEFANLASFPGTGTAGKIYAALDTNKVYRWGGSSYVEISASPGSTDAVPEGAANKYFTDARAQAALAGTLGGYLTANAPIITGNIMWLANNKALWQFDGTHAYFRSQTGNLYLGAAGASSIILNADGNVYTLSSLSVAGEIWVNSIIRFGSTIGASTKYLWWDGASFVFNGGNLKVLGDVVCDRGNGTGVVFLNGAMSRYLFYDGTQYHLSFARLRIAGGQAIRHADTARASSDITFSAAAPSGGADGDIWFQL